MMVTIKLTEERIVCDRCGCVTPLPLDKCLICRTEYCYTCRGLIAGCVTMPDICKDCDDRDDVRKVVGIYATKLARVEALRDDVLKTLPRGQKKDGNRFREER